MYVSVDGNDFPDILFTVKLGSLIYFDIFLDLFLCMSLQLRLHILYSLVALFCDCLFTAHTSIFEYHLHFFSKNFLKNQC